MLSSTLFEGRGLALVLCKIGFNMWQVYTQFLLELCGHVPPNSACCDRSAQQSEENFYFISLLKKLQQEPFGDGTGERGFFSA